MLALFKTCRLEINRLKINKGIWFIWKMKLWRRWKKSVLSFRSSRPEVFCKKDLWSFAKFTGKHLCPFQRTNAFFSQNASGGCLWTSDIMQSQVSNRIHDQFYKRELIQVIPANIYLFQVSNIALEKAVKFVQS